MQMAAGCGMLDWDAGCWMRGTLMRMVEVVKKGD